MSQSAEPFLVRPATPADLPAVLEVINGYARATSGAQRALCDERGRLRIAHGAPSSAERVVAVDESGTIVATLAFWALDASVSHQITLDVRPEQTDWAAGLALLQWAENRAREQIPHAPPGARVVLLANIFEYEPAARALLEQRGFLPVREWIHLAIEMDAPPPVPHWPDDASVRRLDPQRDWDQVGSALEEAFADHWGVLRQGVLQPAPDEPQGDEPQGDEPSAENAEDDWDDPYFNSRDFCFVARYAGDVAGSCLGNARSIEWPDSGRIGSLSVRRAYRRQGIARALMLHALGTFYRHGTHRVLTDTDAAGFTGAYRLYQSLGMQVFRRELTFEKQLRAGEELRVLAAADLT